MSMSTSSIDIVCETVSNSGWKLSVFDPSGSGLTLIPNADNGDGDIGIGISGLSGVAWNNYVVSADFLIPEYYKNSVVAHAPATEDFFEFWTFPASRDGDKLTSYAGIRGSNDIAIVYVLREFKPLTRELVAAVHVYTDGWFFNHTFDRANQFLTLLAGPFSTKPKRVARVARVVRTINLGDHVDLSRTEKSTLAKIVSAIKGKKVTFKD